MTPTRSARAAMAALLFMFLLACPKAPPQVTPTPETPQQKLRREVEELISRARALTARQNELVWKNWTEGAPADFGELIPEERALYTLEALARIDALKATTEDPLDARALAVLRTHFAGEYLSRAIEPETAALARVESGTTFQAGGGEHRLSELERLLARERNALARQELSQRAAQAVGKLTPEVAERHQRTLEVLSQLGYPSYLEFSTELRRAELGELAVAARRVLEVTDSAFEQVIEALAARELRMPRDRVRARDLPRMFRSRDVDELFPKEAVVDRLGRTVAGLGLELNELPGLTIDARELPAKNPRPLALAISVPDDVRLSLRPLPGLKVQAGGLHEVGHVLHAVMTRERRFALAQLGAGAVTEAWSVLFELLVEDPAWLQQQAGLEGERRERYLAASAGWDLYLLRRAAGLFLYQYELHSGEVADPRDLYAKHLSAALRVPFEEEDSAHYLAAQEEFFSSAVTLEAAFLAHQLQAQLKARFGQSWWEARAAGDWLRPLWAHGHALDARELARIAGAPALSPDPLLARLTGALAGGR